MFAPPVRARFDTGSKSATVADLYRVNTELDEDSPMQRREALERQEPFVNTALANQSLGLLAHLIR
jgi:hypothetical protein